MRRDESPTSNAALASKSHWVGLSLVVGLAIILRLAMFVHVHAMSPQSSEDRSIAIHLLQGRGFSFGDFGYFGPTSIRPPVYPMLLTVLDATFGVNSSGATIAFLTINLLAGVGSVVAGFAIGRRLFQSSRAAYAVAILLAILPTQLYAASFAQGLSLAVLFILMTIWLTLSKDLIAALPAGLFAGLSVLTESVAVLPLIGLILVIASRRINFAVLMLAATFAVTTPWLYRNAIVHQQFTGITNEIWHDLQTGNGPDATGSTHLKFNRTQIGRLSPMQSDQLKRQPETVRNDYYRTWSFAWIRTNPIDYLHLCLIRVGKTVWLDWDHPNGLHPANITSRSICFVGWLIAIGMMIRRRRIEWVTLMLSIGLVAATCFTLAEARNGVLVDLPQILAIAWLMDRKVATCVT